MAFPVALLINRPQCDEALEELETELEDLTLRQANFNHRDDRATDRATDVSKELVSLNKRIVNLNRDLDDLDADDLFRPRREAELRAAVKRQGDLTAAQANGSRSPVTAFRLAVDARQVAVQVAELTQAKNEVIAHRATLTA